MAKWFSPLTQAKLARDLEKALSVPRPWHKQRNANQPKWRDDIEDDEIEVLPGDQFFSELEKIESLSVMWGSKRA